MTYAVYAEMIAFPKNEKIFVGCYHSKPLATDVSKFVLGKFGLKYYGRIKAHIKSLGLEDRKHLLALNKKTEVKVNLDRDECLRLGALRFSRESDLTFNPVHVLMSFDPKT